MEVVQKRRWYFMALVFLPFLKGVCADTAPEIETITIHLQEGMVLDCLCPWDGNLTMVSWTKEPESNSIAVFHPEFGVATTYHYRDRIEFLRTTPMDGSISMKNVTHQDIGVYHCSVQTFPQGPWIRNIEVEDLDEPPQEDKEDSVEAMQVDTYMTAELSSNLTLECKRGGNSTTVHQAVVEHMAPGQSWVIIGICKQVEGGVLIEDYGDRGQVNCQDNLDVILQLSPVLKEDGGYYRCSYSTDAGLQTNTFLVTVPKGGFSLSVFMMYVYLAIGTAGLILLTALLIVLLRRRKKNRREDSRDKLHTSYPPSWRQWWANEICGQVY